jgi:hypothetical protein
MFHQYHLPANQYEMSDITISSYKSKFQEIYFFPMKLIRRKYHPRITIISSQILVRNRNPVIRPVPCWLLILYQPRSAMQSTREVNSFITQSGS